MKTALFAVRAPRSDTHGTDKLQEGRPDFIKILFFHPESCTEYRLARPPEFKSALQPNQIIQVQVPAAEYNQMSALN